MADEWPEKIDFVQNQILGEEKGADFDITTILQSLGGFLSPTLMARRPRLFTPGLLYYAIVRGNQRRKTFLIDSDYQAYLTRLGLYRRRYDYTIHAYCLMPNPVHLLVESSRQPLGKFMQGLHQSYSQYFNLRHRKSGHVFQERYKAIVCDKDEYLLQLIR